MRKICANPLDACRVRAYTVVMMCWLIGTEGVVMAINPDWAIRMQAELRRLQGVGQYWVGGPAWPAAPANGKNAKKRANRMRGAVTK